jgi:hypothetical protein
MTGNEKGRCYRCGRLVALLTRSLTKIRMSGIDAATIASASSAGDWAEVLFEEVRASHFATIPTVNN